MNAREERAAERAGGSAEEGMEGTTPRARQRTRRDVFLVTEAGPVAVRVVVLTHQGTRRILGGIAGAILAVDHFSQVRNGGQLMAHVRDGAGDCWSLGEGDYLIPKATAPRSQLGAVVGAILKAWGELENDPMSEAVGFHPDPRPTLERIAEKHGWSLEGLALEAERRGVSEKWIYVSGLSHLAREGRDS